jgi:hypothetical protein
LLYLLVRGVSEPKKSASSADPKLLQRFDVIYAFTNTLAMIETARGVLLASRCLVSALRAGERARLPLALWMASVAVAGFVRPDHPRIARWIALGEQIADGEPESEVRYEGMRPFCEGFTAFMGGRWRRALDACLEAEAILERCPGRAAELQNARALATWAHYYLGRVRVFSERSSLIAREARARGNLFLLNAMVNTWGPLVHLCRDDVTSAAREAEEAIAAWPGKWFQLQHYWNMLAQGCIDLYAGEGERLHARMERDWPALRGSGLLFSSLISAQLLQVRAAACLAAAESRPPGRDRTKVLRDAERHARRFSGLPIIGVPALAALVDAGIASVRGEVALARQHLSSALEGFERAEMKLHVAAAQRQLGRLRGGDEGAKLIAKADAYMTGEGIAKPERFAAMIAPGFRRRLEPPRELHATPGRS